MVKKHGWVKFQMKCASKLTYIVVQSNLILGAEVRVKFQNECTSKLT